MTDTAEPTAVGSLSGLRLHPSAQHDIFRFMLCGSADMLRMKMKRKDAACVSRSPHRGLGGHGWFFVLSRKPYEVEGRPLSFHNNAVLVIKVRVALCFLLTVRRTRAAV